MTIFQFIAQALRFAFVRPSIGLLLLVGLLGQVFFYLAIPLTYSFIFDDAIAGKNVELLGVLLLVQLGLFVLFGLAGMAHDRAAARIGSATAANLRKDLFEKLQAQGSGFYARVDGGDIGAAFGPDVAAVETAMVRAFPSFVMRAINITLSTALLFAIDWHIAVLTVCMMPLVVLASRPFSSRARQTTHQRDGQQSKIAAFVQENVLTHLTIRTFNLLDDRMRQFTNRLDQMRQDGFLSHIFTSLVSRSTLLSSWFLQITVLGAGAWLATTGEITIGVLVASMGLLLNICGATDQLAQTIPFLVNGASGLARIYDLKGHVPVMLDAPHGQALSKLRNSLSLKDVTFGYVPDTPILKGVSFDIPAGKRVAIVGSSGSGKSTALYMLVHLYDPQSGEVFYDDINLKDTQEESFRRQTSIVLQNTVLFDTTIRENIRSGRLDATNVEIEDAAKAAKLHDLVLSLPDGYETRVGLQGVLLSGGQRQRVAIARALLRKASVLFLDEATSALDAVTESAINETLDGVMQGWTVVSVTHRLRHIKQYDLIIVMDQGRVAEMGSHQHLLALGGAYAGLWNKQSGFVLQDGAAVITPQRLRAIPFLSGCSNAVVDVLCQAMVSESFPAGRIILEEGDPGDKFYVIVRGRVEFYVELGEGRETLLSVMQDGDWFGELALIKRVPRTCSARATTDTICLALDRLKFLTLLESDPKLREQVEETAYARVADLQRAMLKSAKS
jgi:ATP-binding cassette, subfamily B, bacterial